MATRPRLIGVDELRARLGQELERIRADGTALYVTRRGKPAGVLLEVAAYEDLVDRIEYLEDSIAALEAREEPKSELTTWAALRPRSAG